MTSLSRTKLHIEGVHPAIVITLESHGCFSAWGEWEEVSWNSLLWLDVYEHALVGGWVNDAVVEDYRVIHLTLKSLWCADIFETLLAWINDDLARAMHVGIS